MLCPHCQKLLQPVGDESDRGVGNLTGIIHYVCEDNHQVVAYPDGAGNIPEPCEKRGEEPCDILPQVLAVMLEVNVVS